MKGKIKITKDGPYLVSGTLPMEKEIVVRDEFGFAVRWEKGEKYECGEEYALCRCGRTKNHPFCDGAHVQAKFDGTETASRKKYIDQASVLKGPGLDLTDQEDLCFGAGFCRNKRGNIWDLVRQSDLGWAKDLAILEARNCPSGRLIVWDKKTGKPIEPRLSQSISLIEEPDKGVSGPIWAKGNVEIESSDGKLYEKRNYVTLCRCGKSENKPLCDGSHVSGFSDGDESLNRKRKR